MMFFGRKGQKKRHPYIGLAIFGLAATGVISIYNKGKRFIKEKTSGIMSMGKNWFLGDGSN